MSQLSLGFQALYMCSRSVNALEPAVDKDGHAQCTGNTSREPGTVRRTARRPHFSLAFISATVQLRIQVFLVISVYFNLSDILPKSDTFPPGHPVLQQSKIFTLKRLKAPTGFDHQIILREHILFLAKDYYSITMHSFVCNKLIVSKIHGQKYR